MKQIKPALGVMHHIPKSDETGASFKEHIIDFLFELTTEEFHKCLNASQLLRNFEQDTQLFKITIWNLQEYFDVLHSYLESYTNRGTYPENKLPRLEVNRRLVNFLTSVTTYLTYTESNLMQKYDTSSERFKKFKDYTSYAFDNYFSYRFLYHLRNYAQHGGLPITNFSFNSKANPDKSKSSLTSFDVSISRDTLLEARFKWNASLKKELGNGPEDIDINAHLLDFAKCLAVINTKLAEDEFETLLEPATYIQNLVQRASYDSGTPIIFELETINHAEGEIISFPTRIHDIEMKLVNLIINGNVQDIIPTITINGEVQ